MKYLHQALILAAITFAAEIIKYLLPLPIPVSIYGLILLFLLLIIQGIVIAWNAPDRFGSLLVVGCMAQISFQFLFNVAVVTNTIPNTGISLPFFSSGGTSLLMLLGQMGVVMSVCRAGNRKKADEKAAAEQEKQAQRAREEADPYARFGR